ncbi:MAG TPA: glycosyltransferase family 39 protein, partial [Thiobacillaceae bacterium]|nr:glycosyltransferase family 39 protein [Thiobacillaceae bacterium]
LNLLGLALFLALLTAIAIVSRPLTPIDETRYVSVAWEMWLRGDFWVPFKNGVPYSDKPPLLLWLYQIGWAVFGVNDWWPRLVSPISSLICLGLTAMLARQIRPELREVSISAPWILASSLLWILFSTSAMFDVLLTVWVLLGVSGIWLASQGKLVRGFGLLGLAIGFGVLAKGPVILLHVLPLAVLAPWWSPGLKWKRWYGAIVVSVLMGAAIALAWAIPAGFKGGEEFRHAIFWGQTANRMVDSFAHRRPFWWYLPLLPVLLYPWMVWPGLWRAVAATFSTRLARGMKFCLAWGVPVFVAFSLISGKQIHYLVPLFPMFALLSAQALADRPQKLGRGGLIPAAFLLLTGAAALWFALRGLPAHNDWAEAISPWAGSAMLGLGLLWLVVSPRLHWRHGLVGLAFALPALVQLGVVRPLASAYDVTPMALQLRRLQQNGVPIAHEGKYHAQYQFAGRLERPLEVISSQSLPEWFSHHPQGRAVVYVSSLKQAQALKPEFYQLYRGDVAVLVTRDQLAHLSGVRVQGE